MSKILVTGGTGFIGSYLVRSLVKNDNKVVILDNNYNILSTGGTYKHLINNIHPKYENRIISIKDFIDKINKLLKYYNI